MLKFVEMQRLTMAAVTRRKSVPNTIHIFAHSQRKLYGQFTGKRMDLVVKYSTMDQYEMGMLLMITLRDLEHWSGLVEMYTKGIFTGKVVCTTCSFLINGFEMVNFAPVHKFTFLLTAEYCFFL
mmetsp:Transcript_34383/g.34560  ORF Transcript_34383/g.34560 Transcript_34383/m.34560 type:complete len:124 (+) Transcript_34383:184-555(+)